MPKELVRQKSFQKRFSLTFRTRIRLLIPGAGDNISLEALEALQFAKVTLLCFVWRRRRHHDDEIY